MSLQVAVVLVAAGRGARMQSEEPKQYLRLSGRAVLSRAMMAFLDHPMVGRIMTVIHADDAERFAAALAETNNMRKAPITSCHGGETRQESVAHGLKALADAGFPAEGIVLIHDAARPLVPEAMITRAIAEAMRSGGAIPVMPLVDTLVTVDGDTLDGALDRGKVRAVQTPQAFRFGLIRDAHERAARENFIGATDDAGVAAWAGNKVTLFDGSPRAFKLTTPEDISRATGLLGRRRTDLRSATGYDVHAFGPGDHIMLGGVALSHDRGVVGHSDADVLLHALTDALLGCLADGDIGQHFPPSDQRWKGAASRVFLAEAVRRVAARGGEIRHLDATVICESPRIGPHRDKIRAVISEIAGVDESRVSLKATTSEQLGFTGRREGIAAMASATVALPEGEQ